jgi:hypothetical protein
MSHWKKFTSNVLTNTNAVLLTKALSNLGITLDENIKDIKNTWGNEKVDAGFVKNGNKIALGVKYVQGKEGTTVELRGDFWATGLNEATFMDEMAQQYQKEHVIDVCENQGWNIDEISTNEKGEIVIGASQWA